jgi:uncharacterized membrane protein YdfJ with MMPL/SSD domain
MSLEERDLKIAEELGSLKALMTVTHDKVVKYCEENKEGHTRMWRKIDKHSRFISWLSGAIAVIVVIVGLAVEWVRYSLKGT